MDLTDEQWEVLEPLIPDPPRRAEGRELSRIRATEVHSNTAEVFVRWLLVWVVIKVGHN